MKKKDVHIWQSLPAFIQRRTSFLGIVILTLALPLLVFTLQQRQTIEQRAQVAGVGIPSQGPSRFEPPDGKAFYGMGQELNYVSGAYTGRYTNETQPGICTVYSRNGVRPRLLSGYMGITSSNKMQEILNNFTGINSQEGNYYIPLIGIASAEYTDQLLNGDYDANLHEFGAQAKIYGKPIFIRPVYEINGGASGDLLVNKYGLTVAKQKAIESYRHIVDRMKEGAGGDLVNVAWVLHYYPVYGDNTEYNSWFPGNRYVDWIGMSQFTSASGPVQVYDMTVVNFANSKALPVIIPESAPAVNIPGGVTNSNIINSFFNPYFSNIENASNHIKAFMYINNNYTNVFSGWADTRIQSNPLVVDKFVAETQKTYFQVPTDTLRIGQKPYEGAGITAGWQSLDNVYYNLLSGDKYWLLNLGTQQWVQATNIWNVIPFNSAPVIDGYRPWEVGGITAVYQQNVNGVNLLNVVSANRMYIFDYGTNSWRDTNNYFGTSATWQAAPLVNGLKPWQGNGITAVWIQPDNIMRVVSKDRMYRYNRTTGVWDTTTPTSWGVFPLGNTVWQAAPLVDGLRSWEGAGITAAWMKDNRYLQVKSKDRYWELDTSNYTWTSFFGNYRDQENTTIWKKAPFIEIAGAPQPNTNQNAACPLPATPTSIPPTAVPPTPVLAIPPPPGPITVACKTTGSATISWGSSSGAASYYFRITNNTTKNTQYATCSTNIVYPTNYLGDRCVDALNATSYTMPIELGSAYYTWVHAANVNGYGGISGATALNFSCPRPTAVPSGAPTKTPTPIASAGTIFHRQTISGASSGSNKVVASGMSATSGNIYLVAVSSRPKVSVTSVTGLGLIWSRMKAQCSGRNATGVEIWRGVGTPSSGSVTATLASSAKNVVITASRYGGATQVLDPYGRNTLGINGACSGGVDSSSYSASIITSNSKFLYVAIAKRDRIHTPASGFIERIEKSQGTGSDVAGIAIMDKSYSSSANITVAGTFSGVTDWAISKVELSP